MSFSQHNEEPRILEYFQRKPNGYFVDIGAGDGVLDSNTRALYQLGWSGLLIEASRTRFAQLVANYSASHRVALVHACVDRFTGLGDFYECPKQLNWSTADEAWMKECGGRFINSPCLHVRLDALNIAPHPDFLSIDTEGLDASILEAMPDDFKPRLILCEIDKGDAAQRIQQTMTKRGYGPVWKTIGNAAYELRRSA